MHDSFSGSAWLLARHEYLPAMPQFCEGWNLLAMHKILRGMGSSRDAWIFCEVWNLLTMHELSVRYEIFSRYRNIDSQCMNWLSMHEYELAMHEFSARYGIFSRCMNYLRGMKSSRDAGILTRNAWILTRNAWILTSGAWINSRCMIFCGAWISSRNA